MSFGGRLTTAPIGSPGVAIIRFVSGKSSKRRGVIRSDSIGVRRTAAWFLTETTIQDAQGLSQVNKKLLQQRGAVGEPVPRFGE